MDLRNGKNDQGTSENSKAPVNGAVLETAVVISSDEATREETTEVLIEGPEKVLDECEERVRETADHVDQETSRHSCCLADRNVLETVINVDLERVDGGVENPGAKGNELDSRKVLEESLPKKVFKEESSCVVDVMCGKAEEFGENSEGEIVCRICHLSADQSPKASRAATKGASTATTKDLILLGCGCKDELGTAHRHCAEAWFKLKGNRLCEICGEVAKNITGVGDSRFMEAWNEGRFTINGSSSERTRRWRGQPLCNFLMACLVIAFVLPWFFRVNMF